MKSFSIQVTPDNLEQSLQALDGESPQLVMVFASTANTKNGQIPDKIKQHFPEADIIGCSTSGEIGSEVEDDSVSIIGMTFEHTRFECAAVPIESADRSHDAGRKMAQALMQDDLAGIFVLLPGVNVNGSKFTLGLKSVLPGHVSVSGGLAGDGLNFKETATILNDQITGNMAVAFGVYGDKVKLSSSSGGGWKPFGPVRRVTKAEDNILYELDGESALALYKEYLGDKAADLPSSGLLYPFAIMNADKKDAVGLIRTILDIDEESNSLVLAGDLNVGQHVCLMHANTDELVDGAERAAHAANNSGSDVGPDNKAVICVSCVGRKILMGDDTEDELDVIRDVFGENSHIAGFYSYGEIGHFEDTGEPELHNQTMTITCIHESAD